MGGHNSYVDKYYDVRSDLEGKNLNRKITGLLILLLLLKWNSNNNSSEYAMNIFYMSGGVLNVNILFHLVYKSPSQHLLRMRKLRFR